MEAISPAAGNVVPGPERPSPFSQLVYTSNHSYIVHSGDLRKIHKAASRGQVRKLEKMTKRKKTINLNIQDAEKRTALHWACVNGHEEVVTFLVDRKCQLDVLDGEHRTPLMKALQCHQEACANILIDSGADLNLVDVYGNMALHYAVYSEILSVVAKLLSHGAVIEVHNKASLTPLLLSITKRSEQIVEFLLTKNANANAVNKYKCTALMLAVCHGSSEIVGMLLQQNVDVFAADICGVTAEHYAVTCGFHHIHEQIMEYIRKLSKNHQNTNPEGTSAGTPDEAAPLAERTPDTAESLVEKTPDEAAPLVERTPDTAESLVEKTPDEAAPLVERTPDTAESLVEKTPDEAASLVEGASDKIQCLEKATSGKFEQSAEETPREITSPAKETSEKFTWPAKGRPRKIAWEKKDTPREIMSPAKETSEKFTWAAKGRPRKIAWEKKETPVKTGCVARVTSNKTKVLEKGRSKMIACPTKESSTKASANDQRFPSESKQEEDEEYSCDSRSLFESSAKIQVCIPESIYQKVMEINIEVEEPPKKPSAFKPAIEMQNSVPNKAFELKNEQTLRADPMFPPESKQKDYEENSWDSESLCETVSQKDVCLPKATHQKEIDKINGKLEESPNKDGLLKATCRTKVSIPTKALELKDMQTFKAEPPEKPSAFEPAIEMQKSVPNKALELKNEQTLRADEILPSESKQKDYEENSWDTESLCETVSQKVVCLPKATHQKEIDKINGKLEDEILPSESKQKDYEENSWDTESLRETVSQKVVCLPKATHQKEIDKINGKLEDEILPSESKQKDYEENSWDTESLRETVSQKVVCLPKATHQKEIDKINGKLEDEILPSESKQKDYEENSWDTESLRETVSQKVVCLPKATHQKEIDKINGKLEDEILPSESKQKDYEENSWDTESLRETVSQKVVCLPKATHQKEIDKINGKLEDEILPSESKQKDYEENSWDTESLRETVSQKVVCLPKATHQKEIDKINGKLEDEILPSESKQKDYEENSWDTESLRETVSQKVVCLPKATHQKEIDKINGKLEDEILPSESKQKDYEENSWDTESLRETVSQKVVCLPKATHQKEIDKINGKLEDEILPSESKQKDYEENSWDTESLRETVSQKVVCLPKATHQKEIDKINGKLEDEILPSESKQKDYEENSWDTESLRETVSQKVVCLPKATHQKEIDKINGKLEDEILPSESKQKDYEENSWDTESLRETVSQKVVCLPKATHQKEIDKINGKLEDEILPSESKQKDYEENSWDTESLRETVSQKVVCLPKATHQKEIDKINGKLEDEILPSESKQKDYEENSWDTESLRETVSQKVVCLPKATHQKEIDKINGKLEDEILPSESKQKDYEENSWDTESLRETVSQKVVCLPKATHQKEIDKINGKLEDEILPSESKQKDYEENSWDTESLRETVSQKVVCLPKATHQKEIDKINGKLEDEILPSESKQKDYEENSWDTESLRETVSQKVVCLPKATHQKEIDKINGKLEDEILPSESKQKDYEENSWDTESLRETVSQKVVCLPKATHQKEIDKINGKLEDEILPSESKQKDYEENSWDTESLRETVSQKVVCLPKATHQKEIDKINGKLEDEILPSESKQKDYEENSWDTESLRETVSQKVVCLPKATHQKEIDKINGKLEDEILPSESKQKDYEENSWDTESLRETVSQKVVCLPKATHQKEIDKINGKLEDEILPSESKQKDYEENSWDTESLRETVSQKVVCLPKAAHQKEIDKINGKLEARGEAFRGKNVEEEQLDRRSGQKRSGESIMVLLTLRMFLIRGEEERGNAIAIIDGRYYHSTKEKERVGKNNFNRCRMGRIKSTSLVIIFAKQRDCEAGSRGPERSQVDDFGFSMKENGVSSIRKHLEKFYCRMLECGCSGDYWNHEDYWNWTKPQ
nr:ankyrin repeat domain-containing protein 30A [Gorilla gorilla gorilla]